MNSPSPTASTPLLEIRNLSVNYIDSGNNLLALSNISLSINKAETVGLVGESGCGKSTLARAILQLPRPTAGQVLLEELDLTSLDQKELRQHRPSLQIIFQDPISSLNPALKIATIIGAPLRLDPKLSKNERLRRVKEMVTAVGLDPDQTLNRRPSQLSGGQCQRVSIARALIANPKLLICDEPVSALDVSIQAQIINLLIRMKKKHALSMLFISHDLAVVKNICDRVAVMYLGKLCEVGPVESLYNTPQHPYTKALLQSVPVPDPKHTMNKIDILKGELPSPLNPPSGCRFRTRCPYNEQICAQKEPVMQERQKGHFAACHLVG